MLCERPLGTITDAAFADCGIDYIELDWFDANKKILKRTSLSGEELSMRLDDTAQTRGLRDGDVLFHDNDRVLAVRIVPCEVIAVQAASKNPRLLAKAAYEIGNRHAPLFWNSADEMLLTPFDEPMFELLSRIGGLSCTVKIEKLDLDHRTSGAHGAHTH